ncbi:MAG TPA: peptidase domain-containing ABC transporter [Parasegetibacter sp.]
MSLQFLRQKCQVNRAGVSLLGICDAAESIGLRTLPVKVNFEKLQKQAVLPFIAHWKQNHFVVVYKISASSVYIADPAKGRIKLSKADFLSGWISTRENGEDLGIALLAEPTHIFDKTEDDEGVRKLSFGIIASYFLRYKKLFFQLALGLLVGSILSVILPFLTQAVVDTGISTGDVSFITLILIGQLMIFAGSTVVEFIRSWILLHISTRINISLLTDFFIKLMQLPLSYFDVKMVGDITQRMGDHKRIESFLTNSVLNIAFSLINFIVFTFIVIAYDIQLFIVFLIGSIVYFLWILLFLKVRRNLDYKRFDISSANQNATIEMIQGMQEIKLNNCEKEKRWKWERIQARLFKLSIKSLMINQVQQGGALFINQGKNILITFLSALAVIEGDLTLGGMMAVQYIIGQLNSPVQQMITFVQTFQDAKISLDRINEIHTMDDEESSDAPLLTTLPQEKSIVLKNLSFTYPGLDNEPVLKNISLEIPAGKTTAIVGMSGSGKTTLLKILLRFYNIEKGEIRISKTKLSSISHSFWRGRCGIVMQEGYIFSDTIAANIAVGEEFPDTAKLLNAAFIANIQDFIESLPLGFNTKIGADGSGISQGQKQRILIARTVYKDPDFIFFDEATNALDANNEKIIMENLEDFFKGRTVVIVAHRLSTVKNADQIIVLHEGEITEQGTHESLVETQGDYYKLVKNQLELGT